MATGIDARSNCASAAACLRQAGIDFVGRYYAGPQEASKVLTRAEAQALNAAGLQVVAVWEDGYPTQASYFSQARGESDGQTAFGLGRGLGQPSSAPIYFAVDYDAPAADIAGPITAYFQGIRQAFAAAAGGGASFPVGVYGSGATCQAILQAGLATYAWLAESSGWTGSKSFGAWNIKQSPAQQPLCGLSIDHDQGQGDYGGFTI
jgi:hypothetical protein